MLTLGASKHWSYAMNSLTGSKTISAKPLLEYYEPLMTWLKNENMKFPNEKLGW